MVLSYDIERVLAVCEGMRDAIASALMHNDIPDWLRHRLYRLSKEAEIVQYVISNHHKKPIGDGAGEL